jgi:UPF0242 C-terminal PAS-like domain/Uncharacterised protein family (UPF0242) N-terminus
MKRKRIDKIMMGDRIFSRYQLVGVMVCCYSLPILFLTTFGFYSKNSWSLFSLGLVLLVLGSSLFFWILTGWEKLQLQRMQNLSRTIVDGMGTGSSQEGSPEWIHLQGLYDQSQAAFLDLEGRQNEYIDLISKQTAALDELKYDRELIKQDAEQQALEFQEFRDFQLQESDKQQNLLLEHQQTIAEQRLNIEKKQQQIVQLETKVRDLNYELKTLLRLAETPISTPLERSAYFSKPLIKREDFETYSQNSDEPEMQLKRCLDIAQNINGVAHFGGISRLRDLTLDHFALDQRRLFDRLGGETGNTVFFYSLKDNKVLFVNDDVKELLGILPEKFIQNFTDLMQVGMEEWKKGLNQLSYKNETKTFFPLKTRSGQEILVNCLLGMISVGLFRQHVIGVMYTE